MPDVKTPVSEEIVQERLAFVRGAMGAASANVSDELNEVLEQLAREQMTTEDALRQLKRSVLGDDW